MIPYLETARQRKACVEQERLHRLDFAWEIARLAAQIVYQQFSDILVDLIVVEEASNSLQQVIEKEGQTL